MPRRRENEVGYACPVGQALVTYKGEYFCVTQNVLNMWAQEQKVHHSENVEQVYNLLLPSGKVRATRRAQALEISDRTTLEALKNWQLHQLLEKHLLDVLHLLSSRVTADLLLEGAPGPEALHAHSEEEVLREYEGFLNNFKTTTKFAVQQELLATVGGAEWKAEFETTKMFAATQKFLEVLSPVTVRACLDKALESLEEAFLALLKKSGDSDAWKESHFCNRYCKANEPLGKCYNRYVSAAEAKFKETYGKFASRKTLCLEDERLVVRSAEARSARQNWRSVAGRATRFEKVRTRNRVKAVFTQLFKVVRVVLGKVWTWMKTFAKSLSSFIITYSHGLLSLQTLVRSTVPKEYCRKETRVGNVLRNSVVDSIFATGDLVNTFASIGIVGLVASAPAENRDVMNLFSEAFTQAESEDATAFAQNFAARLGERQGSAQRFVESILQLVDAHSQTFKSLVSKLCEHIVDALNVVAKLLGSVMGWSFQLGSKTEKPPAGEKGYVHEKCLQYVSLGASVALGVALYSAYKYILTTLQKLPERSLTSTFSPAASQKLADFVQLINFDRWCPPDIKYMYPGTSLEFFTSLNSSDAVYFTAKLSQEWSRSFHLYQILTTDENVARGLTNAKELLKEHGERVFSLVKSSSLACTAKVQTLLAAIPPHVVLAASSGVLVALGVFALGYGMFQLQTGADETALAKVRSLYSGMLAADGSEHRCADDARLNLGVTDSLVKAFTVAPNEVVKLFRPCLKNDSAETLELLHRFPKAGVGVLLLRDKLPSAKPAETELDARLDAAFEINCFEVETGWTVEKVDRDGTAQVSALVTLTRGEERLEGVSARALLCCERNEVYPVGALVAFLHSDELGVVVGHGAIAQRVWVVHQASDPAAFSLAYVMAEDLYVPSRVQLAAADLVVGVNGSMKFGVAAFNHNGIQVEKLPVAPARCLLAFPTRLSLSLKGYNKHVHFEELKTLAYFKQILSEGAISLFFKEHEHLKTEAALVAELRSQLKTVDENKVVECRLRYVQEHAFLPKYETWGEVAHLYTRRDVGLCGDAAFALQQLTEEAPDSKKYDPQRVRVQRAQELAHWLNNPFASVPAPHLFATKQLLTSDEHFKVRLRSRAFARAGGLNIYLYKFDSRRCVEQDDRRPFFGIDASKAPEHCACVVHGRLAVDYNALCPDVLSTMSRLRGRALSNPIRLREWRKVRGTEECYSRAGENSALYYNARTRHFALRFASEARNAHERWWRAEYARQPFGKGFACP